MLELLDFNENPNVGVLCRANDDVCFIQTGLTKKVKKKVSLALEVDLIELSIFDASVIGSLLAFNSNGALDLESPLLIPAGHINFTPDLNYIYIYIYNYCNNLLVAIFLFVWK